MKFNKATFLFAVSSLAIFALIAVQISWMSQSRKSIEQQFNQKVHLALGSAINYINKNNISSPLRKAYNEFEDLNTDRIYIDGQDGKVSIYDMRELDRVLGSYLKAYDVHLDYQVRCIDERTHREAKIRGYSCSLSPMKKACNDYKLVVTFPGKNQYLFGQMSHMLSSSVLILLFISAVFFLINYAFLKQKRITENNVDFFNNTAHEFKTPLTNIILANRLLKRKKPELDHDRYAQVVSRESEKLMDQIERVLHLSQMENGQYQLQKEDVDLGELIEEVIDDMSVLIEENEGRVQLHIPEGTHVTRADRYHLGNVFRNLIDNALKYCTEDPEIHIWLKTDSDGIYLLFEDNGMGISKLDQRHIFRKFQRVNTGDIHTQKGFGIGLSYAKTVLELHRGFIKIISDLNRGSRFDLFLPKA